MGKNTENMRLRIYINKCKSCPLQAFSTIQNIRMQDELSEGLHGFKRTKAAYNNEPACQKDTKAGRLRSSRSVWDSLGPGMVGVVILEQDLAQLNLLFGLTKAGSSLSSMTLLKSIPTLSF